LIYTPSHCHIEAEDAIKAAIADYKIKAKQTDAAMAAADVAKAAQQ